MNEKDIIYPKWRKWYTKISWYLSYFYNIVICVFLYHPEIVDMSLDNVDNTILHTCKVFCIIDICSSPIIPCFIKIAIMDYLSSLENSFGSLFDQIDDEISKEKIKLIDKDYKKNQNQAMTGDLFGGYYGMLGNTFKAIAISSENEERKRRRQEKRERVEFLKENDYQLIYRKISFLSLPNGSLQWYSAITSIYCTLVFILDFTTEGYILWGIYFFLLLNNVFSNQYSLYLNFFKTSEFITHIIQLIDLSSNYAFLYEIGGINNETIEEHGLLELMIYLSLFIVSYTSYISLTYNNFMKIRSVKDEDKDKYSSRVLYSNFIYSIFGAIPISILTIIINNNDNDPDNNNTVTILSVSSSILTFILSVSEIISEKYQKEYKENV